MEFDRLPQESQTDNNKNLSIQRDSTAIRQPNTTLTEASFGAAVSQQNRVPEEKVVSLDEQKSLESLAAQRYVQRIENQVTQNAEARLLKERAAKESDNKTVNRLHRQAKRELELTSPESPMHLGDDIHIPLFISERLAKFEIQTSQIPDMLVCLSHFNNEGLLKRTDYNFEVLSEVLQKRSGLTRDAASAAVGNCIKAGLIKSRPCLSIFHSFRDQGNVQPLSKSAVLGPLFTEFKQGVKGLFFVNFATLYEATINTTHIIGVGIEDRIREGLYFLKRASHSLPDHVSSFAIGKFLKPVVGLLWEKSSGRYGGFLRRKIDDVLPRFYLSQKGKKFNNVASVENVYIRNKKRKDI